MTAKTIYKLLTCGEWDAAQTAGSYRGSAHDRRDGFIHFSTASQLSETARKYFSGMHDLVLLAVDTEALESAPSLQPCPEGERELQTGVFCGLSLRWEPSRGGDLFPHLYGELPLKVVTNVIPIPLGDDGAPLLPDDLPK